MSFNDWRGLLGYGAALAMEKKMRNEWTGRGKAQAEKERLGTTRGLSLCLTPFVFGRGQVHHAGSRGR